MQKRTLAEGEVLYQQDNESHSMFVCLEGLLSSSVETEEEGYVKVRTIRAGQYFGEGAVLGDQRRKTTITTNTEVLLYEITSEAFEPKLEQHTELRDQLQASAGESADEVKRMVEQAVKDKAAKPVVKRKTAMQKVAQAFFPGMFEGGEEEKDK